MPAVEPELPVLNVPLAAAKRTCFHLSLNVADLGRSIEFFTAFFGVAPAKRRADYAKFELDDPPLVLSLEPMTPSAGGALNHLGFRMPDAATLVEVQRRLEMHGVSTQREEGVECCYARQTKFWVQDPDGNLWEVYTLEDDIAHRGLPLQLGGSGSTECPVKGDAAHGRPLAIWSHRLGQPFPAQLFVGDATVDEAHLQGTFNALSSAAQRAGLLADVFRALQPGGALKLHMLTADRPLAPDVPVRLPGPAAQVETVPPLAQVVDELQAAGFAPPQFEKCHGTPRFSVGDVQLRETLLTVRKPTAT